MPYTPEAMLQQAPAVSRPPKFTSISDAVRMVAPPSGLLLQARRPTLPGGGRETFTDEVPVPGSEPIVPLAQPMESLLDVPVLTGLGTAFTTVGTALESGARKGMDLVRSAMLHFSKKDTTEESSSSTGGEQQPLLGTIKAPILVVIAVVVLVMAVSSAATTLLSAACLLLAAAVVARSAAEKFRAASRYT